MAFTCKTCGASFESRSDLATHQAEERKLAAAAESINGRLLDDKSDDKEPPPAPSIPKIAGDKFVVPWAYLDRKFRVLSTTAPVRGYFLGYVTEEGLAISQVSTRPW